MAKSNNARPNVPSPAPAAAPVAQTQAGVDSAKIDDGSVQAAVRDPSSEAVSPAPPDSGQAADAASVSAGSNPPADAVVSCLVLSNLHHNGEHYEPGSTVDLTPDQATQLPGVVKAVADLDANQAAIMAAAVKAVADSEGA